MSIGNRVASSRRSLQMTQKGLSDELIRNGFAVDSSAVSRIESGERELRAGEIIILADVLSVGPGWLFLGHCEPPGDFDRGFAAGVESVKISISEWISKGVCAHE